MKKLLLYQGIVPYFAGLITLVLALGYENGVGQNLTNYECATDVHHNYLMQTDSVYRKHFLDAESNIDAIIQNQAKNPAQTSIVHTIPVVVHIIHLGEAIGTGANISDANIKDALKGINEQFANKSGAGVDVEINFCLAVRDTNGNATSGIIRINGSGVPLYQTGGINFNSGCGGADEKALKDLSKWPVSDYYNIWVVSKICGGYSGYAYKPNGFPYDGMVVDKQYMTYSGTTGTHEMGHAFGLYHTFEGDGGGVSCPPNTSCTSDGDKVCDTPPHKTNDCGTTNPCPGGGSWDNSRKNHMSYCWPRDRFTSGQKTRMQAAASGSVRGSLSSSLGCTPVTTSMSELTADNDILLIPNPSDGQFRIKTNDFKSGKIKIVNPAGEIIYQSATGDAEINLSHQPKGVYFMEVKMRESTYTKKLIVQ